MLFAPFSSLEELLQSKHSSFVFFCTPLFTDDFLVITASYTCSILSVVAKDYENQQIRSSGENLYNERNWEAMFTAMCSTFILNKWKTSFVRVIFTHFFSVQKTAKFEFVTYVSFTCNASCFYSGYFVCTICLCDMSYLTE